VHEFGLAAQIVEQVVAESSRLGPGEKLTAVGLSVGVISGVDADALLFSLEAIAAGEGLSEIEFAVEKVPHRRRCPGCGRDFEVDVTAFESACPSCGSTGSVPIAGHELKIEYIEVEDQ
jgi:hydrogenase nickel incorporation protein HypA/HybF